MRRSAMVARLHDDRNTDRLKAAAGVAAFHALLGYAFLTGLGTEVVTKVSESLEVFDVRAEPPPPIEQPRPASARLPEKEGAAAPPNLKSKPSPVVAPAPKIRLQVPPPVVTAPVASAVIGS